MAEGDQQFFKFELAGFLDLIQPSIELTTSVASVPRFQKRPV
jgi:hypothetical protein